MFIRCIAYLLLLASKHLQVEASEARSYHVCNDVQILQVISSSPSDMGTCLLQTFPLHSAYHKSFLCANYCTKNPDCRLFCIKGDECSLFKTWVTGEYSGTDQDFYGFTSCYTSWFFSNNLAPRAVVTMATPYSENHSENQGTNGYFCYEYDSCSITKKMAYPWWEADLQATYMVSSLIVKPRDDKLEFNNVEIRFGNSPVFSKNSVFGTYPGMTPPAGSVLTFELPFPRAGRYLSFQANSTKDAISICEVQILEA